MSNQSDMADGSTSSKNNKTSELSSSSASSSPSPTPHNPLSNWLNSVVNRKSPSPPSSSNVNRGEREETGGSLDVALEAARDPDVDEEYQIQLALELSAKEDPEAVQIEAVKQISLGSCDPENTPAEVVAYRYWVSH